MWRPFLAAAIAMAATWAGLNLANNWVNNQYYVSDSAGQVAIYQGVSQQIGPIRLSELYDVPGGLPTNALPDVYREHLSETIVADNLDDAHTIIDALRRQACLANQRVPANGTEAPMITDGWLGAEVGYPGLLCASQ